MNVLDHAQVACNWIAKKSCNRVSLQTYEQWKSDPNNKQGPVVQISDLFLADWIEPE